MIDARGNVRLKGLLTALGLLIILGSLIMPNSLIEKIPGIEFLSNGGSLGVGTASAADIDANTITTSTAASATLNPNQRATFYAKSRFWVFFSDGTDLVVRSSLTGSSWSSPTTIYSSCDVGTEFSVWLSSSGDNVSIAWASGSLNTALKYANYAITDAGGITSANGWVNAVAADAAKSYHRPYVCQDVNSKPVISYTIYDGADYTPYCTRSTTTDGTWTTDFNTQLSVTSDATWATTVLPYGSSLMAIYARDTTTVRSKVYDGSWGTENATTSAIEFGEGFSAVTTSDNVVHLVWEYADDDILYSHYHADGTAWEVEEEVYVGSSATKAPVLSKTLDDNLYCFWAGDPATDNICYKGYSGGTWDSEVTHWQDETDITDNASISCAYAQTTCDFIPVVWLTGAGSPYNIRFAALERDIELWESGYLNRQLLSVAAADPQPYLTWATMNVTLDGDSHIRQGAANNNYGADPQIAISKVSSLENRSVTKVDLTDVIDNELPAGANITRAVLYYNYWNDALGDPGGRTLAVKLQIVTFTEGTGTIASPTTTDVSWNRYTGTTNWPGGAGGLGDIELGAVNKTIPASYGWLDWDVTTQVQHCIAEHDNLVRFILYDPGSAASVAYGLRSRESGTNPPYMELTYTYPATPTALDDKINVNVYEGSETVESCDVTIDTGVDNRTFPNRVEFTIKTQAELPADTYPVKIVVDTQALVDGGFLSTDNNGKTVEWADSAGANDMPYWCPETTSAGVSTPRNFNTRATVYYITPQTTLSANTTYTFYLYCDADETTQSPNYSGTGMVGSLGIFEHFAGAVDNLTDFLALYDGTGGYNEWRVDKAAGANDPAVVVAGSVLTLTGTNAAGANAGIHTTASRQNWRCLIGWQQKYEAIAGAGMWDTDGIAGANKDGVLLAGGTGSELRWWGAGSSGQIDIALWSTDAAFTTEMRKYGSEYMAYIIGDDPDGQPDTYNYGNGQLQGVDCSGTENFWAFITAYTDTKRVFIDWIWFSAEVDGRPIITFPDIAYDQVNTVFCDDLFSSSTSWWEELAFSTIDGERLYWRLDELSQLTCQPGNSARITVNLGQAITDNMSFYMYYNCPSPVSPDPYRSGAGTYDTDTETYRWQDFSDNATEWSTEAGGSWSVTSVGDPIISKAPVGNVGGLAGRIWARASSVVKWDTDSYYHISLVTQWEMAGSYWPTPFRKTYIQHSTSPEIAPDVGYTIDGPLNDYNPGPWPFTAQVYGVGDNKTLAISWTGVGAGGGIKISYSQDPSDPDSWQENPNGPFITATWLNDNGGTDYNSVSTVMCGNFFYNDLNSKWYIMVTGTLGEMGDLAYCTAAGDPHEWTVDNITYGDRLIIAGHWVEDDSIIYDSANQTWYWFMVDTTLTSDIGYYTFDEATYNFPGTGAQWTACNPAGITEFNPPYTPMRAVYRSPRLFEDDSGDFIIKWAAQGRVEGGSYTNKWIPNYIFAAKSVTTPATGNYAILNTDYKYKQATTTGLQVAYVTGSDKLNGEIVCEIQIEAGDIAGTAGVVFRYDDSTDTGYLAGVDYNNDSPVVKLKSIDSGSVTAITGASDYAMSQYPVPWLTPGATCQIRVRFYGPDIEVALSLWGNEWQITHSVTLDTDDYYLSGHYGVATNVVVAYFNNFSYADYVDSPPYLIEALDSISIAVSPSSLSGNWAYREGAGAATGSLRENTWYTTETSLASPLFTLSNLGVSTTDITISSSANWTGIGKIWTVSSTGTPGDATIGIWAGLDTDSSYGILVKPDSPPNFLIVGLASSSTQDFGLLFYTCTSNGGNVEMSGSLTLTASVHT